MITEMVFMDTETGIYQFTTKQSRKRFIDLLKRQHHHGVQTDLEFATSEIDDKFIVAVKVVTEVKHTERKGNNVRSKEKENR
jgi:hypothetical protein